MNIYQLLLYKNAQAIQDLDDYQVKEHGAHIEASDEEMSEVSIDTEIEGLEELEQQMKIPTKWKRRPK